MSQNSARAPAGLNTPRAAAIAGIVFSALMIAIFWLLRGTVPSDPLDPGLWIAAESKTVTLALNLVPFAGVAFLWFIGVLRDRLGRQEDRFFATVFLGSGLLFLAMLFAAAAIAGAIMLMASSVEFGDLTKLPVFRFARATVYIIVNAYAMKMACVFMISTSTVVIRTGIAPRRIAILGFILACILLIGSYYHGWSIAVLPIWVLLLSIYILVHNLGRRQEDDQPCGH